MTYQPKRDQRFHYVADVIVFIEERQCIDCVFSENPEEPMCTEIVVDLFLEKPVEALDDRGDDGVVCTKYRPVVEQAAEDDPNQPELF